MDAAIRELKKNFSGEIILPDDSEYETARNVFAFQGKPAVILRPSAPDDIANAITFARNNSLIISVRSGGHSGAGFSTNNGGVVIDLSKIDTVEIIDEPNHIVRIGAGAIWADVAKKLQEKNLAITSGDTKSVGVGGLILGGGIGWMVRKFGLTIDNLIAADIVTADGSLIHTSESEHTDLFWAIRGGGGNFGIVTHFEIKAQPVQKVLFGMIMYSFENLQELLKGWRDHMLQADDLLTTTLMVMPAFAGNPAGVMILCCYGNDDEIAAMKAIDPLKRLGKMVTSNVNKIPYADVLQEAHPPPGVEVIVKSTFVEDFSDDLINSIDKTHGKETGRFLMIRSIGGAINKIPVDATAFAYRKSKFFIVGPMFIPPNASKEVIEGTLKPWKDIAIYGVGAYSNFLSTVTEEDVHAVYPDVTYERLAKIKRIYDPHNIFNQNYNVKPE